MPTRDNPAGIDRPQLTARGGRGQVSHVRTAGDRLQSDVKADKFGLG